MHLRIDKGPATFWLAWLFVSLTGCGGSSSGAPGETGEVPPRPSITNDSSSTSFTVDRAAPGSGYGLLFTLHNTTSSEIFLFGDHTTVAITGIGIDARHPTLIGITVLHRPPTTIFNGTYNDTITLYACLDNACTQPLDGSPLTVNITYTYVGTDPDTGEPRPPPDSEAELPVTNRVALPHNVLDAEYSRSLDRIAMAADYPHNALHIYDVATGAEQIVPLNGRPTAVSISPDGHTAAVGHDAQISIVNLLDVGQPNGQSPLVVNSSVEIFDVVLDGRGRVHVIPDTDQLSHIYSIDVATGAEQSSSTPSQVHGQSFARLHPSGDYLFVGDPLISSASIYKYDITGPAATYVALTRFPKAYVGACGEVWFDDSGSKVISQCGQVFETESSPNTYLSRIGRLDLTGPETTIYAYTISWMDYYAARDEIALIESNAFACDKPEHRYTCYPRFGIFDGSLLTRDSVYSVGPVMIDGMNHAQRPLYVFHKSDGSTMFMLSRLDAMSNPNTEYYLSTLE